MPGVQYSQHPVAAASRMAALRCHRKRDACHLEKISRQAMIGSLGITATSSGLHTHCWSSQRMSLPHSRSDCPEKTNFGRRPCRNPGYQLSVTPLRLETAQRGVFMKPAVLVVDDDPSVVRMLEMGLAEEYEIVPVFEAVQTINVFSETAIDV